MTTLVFYVEFEGWSLPTSIDSVSDIEVAATIPQQDITVYAGESPPYTTWIDVLDWADEHGYRMVVTAYMPHYPSVGIHTWIVQVAM